MCCRTRLGECVRTLDGHDELRHNRQDLRSAVLQEITDTWPHTLRHATYGQTKATTLSGEERIGVCGLGKAVKEEREIVVVVELVQIHLPTRWMN